LRKIVIRDSSATIAFFVSTPTTIGQRQHKQLMKCRNRGNGTSSQKKYTDIETLFNFQLLHRIQNNQFFCIKTAQLFQVL